MNGTATQVPLEFQRINGVETAAVMGSITSAAAAYDVLERADGRVLTCIYGRGHKHAAAALAVLRAAGKCR